MRNDINTILTNRDEAVELLRKAITDNVDIIDNKDFTTMYTKLLNNYNDTISLMMTCLFTEACLYNHINPLHYMNYVPDYYLIYSDCDKVDIPNNITKISSNAFYKCASLTSITIPENVTSIENDAFYNCTGLTEIHFNATKCKDLDDDDDTVFNYAGRSGDGIAVIFGDNVTKIPAYLFYGSSPYCAPKITTVNIGKNVTYIGIYAFYNCILLKSLTFGDSVKTINAFAFSGCSNLTSIVLPKSVRFIDTGAFSYCKSLKSVVIENDSCVVNNAFTGCDYLEEIKCSDKVWANLCACSYIRDNKNIVHTVI